VRGLCVEIPTPAGPIRPFRDVSLEIGAGETVALVGESGSGKSLTALALLGLLPSVARVVAGAVTIAGEDALRAGGATLRRLRGGVAGMVFQDAGTGLNPVHLIGRQIAESVRGGGVSRRAVALLARVGIPDPARRARAFPHELSGGMGQRAMIAMAIANGPAPLIADEPTAALDVTVQAQVLDLLADLQRERGLALLFVGHSLPVAAEIATRVVMMYAGQVVEQGAVAEVFGKPLHPYTAALLASAPHEDGSLPIGIPGIVPAPHALPPGCAFAPRCPRRTNACDAPPPLQYLGGRWTRCVCWKELAT